MASHPSMVPEQDLRMRSHDELVGIVRRLESDKLSLISEHSAVMHDVNRNLHTYLVEIRTLREVNRKAETENHVLRTESAQRARASTESLLAAERAAAEIQRLRESAERYAEEMRRLHESVEQSTAETRELRELCCFLDDDRQRLRRLAEQWQQHGQHVTKVTLDDQGCASFAALASELEQKQSAIVDENAKLRELCLFLDDERNTALASGSAASRPPATEATTAAVTAAAAAATVLDNASLSRIESAAGVADRRRGLGDGASSLPATSVHPVAVATSKNDVVEANVGDTTASYIKALEAKVQSLELERSKYKKILEICESLERLPNAAASVATAGPAAKSVDIHVPATSALLNGMPLQTVRSVPLEKMSTGKDIQQSEKAIVKELCNVLWRKLGNVEASFPSVGARIDPQGGSLPDFDRQGPLGSSSVPATEGFAGAGDDLRLSVPFSASVALTDRNVRVAADDIRDQSQAVPTASGVVRQLPSQPSHAFDSTVRATYPASNESVKYDSSAAVLRASSSGQPPPPPAAAAAAQATLASAAALRQLHVPAAAGPNHANDVLSAAGGASSHRLTSRPGQSSEPAARSGASSTDRYTSFVVTGNALLPNGGDRLQVHRLVDNAGRSASGVDARKDSGNSEAPGTGAVVGRVTLADISGLPARLPPNHNSYEGRPVPAGVGAVPAVWPGEYAAASGRVPSLGDRTNAASVGLGGRGATSSSLGDPGVTRRDVASAGRTDVVQAQQQQLSGASSRSGSVSSTGSWPAAASAASSSLGAGGGRGLLGGSDSSILLQPSAPVAGQQPVATANAATSVRAGSAVSPSGSSSSSSTERLGSQRLATRVPFALPSVQQQQQQPHAEQQQPSVRQKPHFGGASQAPHHRMQSQYGDAHQLL